MSTETHVWSWVKRSVHLASYDYYKCSIKVPPQQWPNQITYGYRF